MNRLRDAASCSFFLILFVFRLSLLYFHFLPPEYRQMVKVRSLGKGPCPFSPPLSRPMSSSGETETGTGRAAAAPRSWNSARAEPAAGPPFPCGRLLPQTCPLPAVSSGAWLCLCLAPFSGKGCDRVTEPVLRAAILPCVTRGSPSEPADGAGGSVAACPFSGPVTSGQGR